MLRLSTSLCFTPAVCGDCVRHLRTGSARILVGLRTPVIRFGSTGTADCHGRISLSAYAVDLSCRVHQW